MNPLASRGMKPDAVHPGPRTPSWIPRLVSLAALLLAGCAHPHPVQRRAAAVAGNAAALAEESRALTTAALEAVSLAPTNPPTLLAKRLLRHDQQIEGLPVERIEVEPLLTGQADAGKALEERIAVQGRLLRQRDDLETQLRQTENKLIELGQQYEADQSRHRLRRFWRWAVGTLGLGGLIAACVLCPAVLPMLGSLLGWLIGKVPALAGFLGLVGRRAFDGVVQGVGEVRRELKRTKGLPPERQPNYRPAEVLELMDNTLKRTTEGTDSHRDLIEARRAALKV